MSTRSLARVALALSGLLGVMLTLTAPGCSRRPTARAGARLLVIGVDGASWDEILPLLRAGDLPVLAGLMKEGFSARLTTMAPALSPVVWTTIATGRTPEHHGIRHFLARDRETGKDLPVTSNLRLTSAVWDILGRSGVKVGVVGWWVTWPAERVEGWMVSPYAAPGQATWKGSVYAEGVADQTWPPEFIQELAPDIRDRVEGADAEFSRLFPLPPGFEPSDWLSAYLRDTRWVHVSDAIFREAAIRILGLGAPPFTAVYFGSVDVVGHRFWRFAHPETGSWPSRDAERAVLGGGLANAYRWVDEAIGRVRAAAPPGTAILVVSDHGMGPARPEENRRPATPWNLYPQEISGGHVDGPDGILVFAGTGAATNFDPAWLGSGSGLPRVGVPGHPGVLDITPSILHYFGLPAGADMEGQVALSLFGPPLDGPPLRRVATWDDGASGPRDRRPIDSPRVEEIRKRLEGLGYIGD